MNEDERRLELALWRLVRTTEQSRRARGWIEYGALDAVDEAERILRAPRREA